MFSCESGDRPLLYWKIVRKHIVLRPCFLVSCFYLIFKIRVKELLFLVLPCNSQSELCPHWTFRYHIKCLLFLCVIIYMFIIYMRIMQMNMVGRTDSKPDVDMMPTVWLSLNPYFSHQFLWLKLIWCTGNLWSIHWWMHVCMICWSYCIKEPTCSLYYTEFLYSWFYTFLILGLF